jgi:lipoyl(octanoyl) transferase
MSAARQMHEQNGPAVAAYLLGLVEFEACLALQQRLVYETTGRADGHITLLVCEHPATITIGRNGSRADVRFRPTELTSNRLDVRWVNRGGPALFHGPGQLAVYPIVPLDWHRFTVGDYRDRLQAGILAALVEAGIGGQTRTDAAGIWGRSGQLVSLGVAVKSSVSYFGAYINVCPAMQLARKVRSDLVHDAPPSALVVERPQNVRMSGVRERVVRHLSAALGCDRYHVHAGHPLLVRRPQVPRETAARAG